MILRNFSVRPPRRPALDNRACETRRHFLCLPEISEPADRLACLARLKYLSCDGFGVPSVHLALARTH
ncbi:MAG: hypothetical protein AB1586_11465 [Pseudomonadota bacterium]